MCCCCCHWPNWHKRKSDWNIGLWQWLPLLVIGVSCEDYNQQLTKTDLTARVALSFPLAHTKKHRYKHTHTHKDSLYPLTHLPSTSLHLTPVPSPCVSHRSMLGAITMTTKHTYRNETRRLLFRVLCLDSSLWVSGLMSIYSMLQLIIPVNFVVI